jgi:hypothetical protein
MRDIVIPTQSSGEVRTFRPDGTGSLDYGPGVVESGTYNGHFTCTETSSRLTAGTSVQELTRSAG